jgi:hypothetical protein
VYTTRAAWEANQWAQGLAESAAAPPPLLSVAQWAQYYVRHGDTVADLSCGKNEWLGHMESIAGASNLAGLSYKAFDKRLPPPGEQRRFFTACDWSDVTAERLGAPGDRLVLGCCAPWGTGGASAAAFMLHCASLRPRVLVLVCPPSVPLPPGYLLLLRQENVFNGGQRPWPLSRLKEPLWMFIMQRRDMCRPFDATDPVDGSRYTCWDPDPECQAWVPVAEPGRAGALQDGEEEAEGADGAELEPSRQESERDSPARPQPAPQPAQPRSSGASGGGDAADDATGGLAAPA